jgi:hypothetical protein
MIDKNCMKQKRNNEEGDSISIEICPVHKEDLTV